NERHPGKNPYEVERGLDRRIDVLNKNEGTPLVTDEEGNDGRPPGLIVDIDTDRLCSVSLLGLCADALHELTVAHSLIASTGLVGPQSSLHDTDEGRVGFSGSAPEIAVEDVVGAHRRLLVESALRRF